MNLTFQASLTNDIRPYVFLPKYRILVCTKCGFGSVSDEVATHLSSRHRDLSPKDRRKLVEAIRQIPNVIRNQVELLSLQYPDRSSRPIPYLAAPILDALKCRACGFIVRQVQKMQEHCTSVHHWTNPRGKGRPQTGSSLPASELPWTQNVPCQRFFPSRTGSKWFEVVLETSGRRKVQAVTQSSSTHILAEAATLTPEAESHLKEVIGREQKYQDATNNPRVYGKAVSSDSFAATDLWIERTRWPVTYRGARRDILRAMTRLHGRGSLISDCVLGPGACEGDADIVSPREDEQKISCITGALDLVLDRCENTVRHTSHTILCWLRSGRLEYCRQKPFTLVAERSSTLKYRRLEKRLLSFIIRAFRMANSTRETPTDIKIGAELLRQLKGIWEHELWSLVDVSKGYLPRLHNVCDGIGGDDDAFTYSAVKRRRDLDHLDDNMMLDDELKSDEDEESCDEEDEDEDEDENEGYEDEMSEDDDPRKSDSDFEDSGYTSGCPYPDLRENAADEVLDDFLERLFQLCCALCTETYIDGQPGSTVLVYFSGILGFSPDCQKFLLARQYCSHLSGLIYIQRLLLLERALPLNPYPRIGIQQRSHTNQLEHLNTTRGKYMVIGSQSPLGELQSLRDFGRVIARTETPPFLLRWSEDGEMVSCGDLSLTMERFRRLSDHFITRAEEVSSRLMFGLQPEFDLSRVKDNMANSQCGYSFVQNPDNGLDEAYLELLVRAHTSRTRGLAKHGQWSWNGVTEYLKEVNGLEEVLAGGLFTACGQTPRVRELFSLECENGPSTSCGFYIWERSLVYVLRHHKAKRQTNREFYVVRFLPARLARSMYNYLVYIRRFARLLQRDQLYKLWPGLVVSRGTW